MEMFVLVELDPADSARVLGIVRTYEGKTRADEDIDLLRSLLPGRLFEARAVEHIDR